jgi:rare lipoprotein A
LGSKLRVTNKTNGKSVIVRINDRGPFHKGRLIDVSYAAAQKINMVSAGMAKVRLDLIR